MGKQRRGFFLWGQTGTNQLLSFYAVLHYPIEGDLYSIQCICYVLGLGRLTNNHAINCLKH